jgi:predicted dehydrogenase
MSLNPVISKLGRRLRLAMIGGGEGSFIGAMHRQAARMDDRYEIVTGVFSSNPEKSKKVAVELGLDPARIYPTVHEMLSQESLRKDGIDAVAIMTPNDSHYEYSVAALEKGLDVICDKPMTNTYSESLALHNKVKETGLIFCLTHNYTGYPMVRQAKAMIEANELGEIRLVQVEYVQGGRADESKVLTPEMSWKYDPIRGGAARSMVDVGTHAHNLLRFMSGLEVTQVCAEIGASVPGRSLNDYAGALIRLSNGARGTFWATQAAAGVENGLRIRISGSKGTIEWCQEIPQTLSYKPLHGPAETRTPNGPGTYPFSVHSSRIKAGHPEGFPEAFANLYTDAADAIVARKLGETVDPLSSFFPNSYDGLMTARFVECVIESSNLNGSWVDC